MKNARTSDCGSQRGQQRNAGSGAKNLRSDSRFQNEISDRPHCPVMAPPSALPAPAAARMRRPLSARERTANERHKPRLYLRHQFAVHRKRSQPAQQQREPKSVRAAAANARASATILFRIQKNTPCRTYASQHIPAGGESFRKQLYTSGPFGSSCFGSSFFVSFAFCLAALRSCASLAACASARAFVEMAHLATWMRT